MIEYDKVWDEILLLDPLDVCQRADVRYETGKKEYSIRAFNSEFIISPGEKDIRPSHESDCRWLNGIEGLFNMSALQYLIKAKCIPVSERLINYSDLKGGGIFFSGSHVLPLDPLAQKYKDSPQDFLTSGLVLGGKVVSFGDAAIELRPLPKIPITLIFWKEDDEFPSRMSLLFDSTADQHLPIDVLWAIAIITIRAFYVVCKNNG